MLGASPSEHKATNPTRAPHRATPHVSAPRARCWQPQQRAAPPCAVGAPAAARLATIATIATIATVATVATDTFYRAGSLVECRW